MELTIEDRKAASIKNFQEAFFTEFGEDILVAIEVKKPKITLFELEDIVNTVVHKEYPNIFPGGIRGKSRKAELVMCRFCFYKLSQDMKYRGLSVARFLNVNHASIIYGIKIIRSLIVVREHQTMYIINKIYYELEERFGINADIQFDKSAGDKL